MEGLGTTTLVRRVLALAALVAVSLAVCAGSLELGLRLLWGGYYEKFDPERPFGEFDFHPVRGLTPAPSYERLQWNREFQVTLRHNSMGFRSPEIALEKPPGRTRLLVLGDSMTYGVGVENDETYCAVLEALDPRLQVINAGVPGYSGAQELSMLQEHVGELAPDVVLVAYFWNDVGGAPTASFPHYELREGRLHFVPADPASPEHPAFDHLWRHHRRRARRYASFFSESYLYRFVSDRLKVLRYALRDLAGEVTEVERGGELDAQEEAAAWELSYALLRAQRDLSEARGAKFAILVVPDQVQVEPDVKVYAVPPLLWGIQEHIVAFGEREGIPVIDPLETMRGIRAREGEPQYHRLDRHWNRVGHRHMGRVLLAELRRLGLVPPPPG